MIKIESTFLLILRCYFICFVLIFVSYELISITFKPYNFNQFLYFSFVLILSVSQLNMLH